MPIIYDNIEGNNLSDGLRKALGKARRADFCAGYFNLRGWAAVCDQVQNLPGDGEKICRLIVGMPPRPEAYSVRQLHGGPPEDPATNADALQRRRAAAEQFAKQLTLGTPGNADRATLQKLHKQLLETPVPRLRVKLFTRHPLHAKLYLVHYGDQAVVPIVGFLGSSNLTLAGLKNNGELNVDVTDNDAAQKLDKWFEGRWDDRLCLDITEELAEIIDESWAGKLRKPHHIYIKTAWHLSHEEMDAAKNFAIPAEFKNVLLPFQARAVQLAAQRLNRAERGVVIGDVVGLGKTMVAAAVAKTFQEDRGDNALVICPPRLIPMWKEYLQEYKIAGDTLSLGTTNKLADLRRYALVVVDESHNLRNRQSARHAHVRDYIRQNDSAVILLTATPYNKEIEDLTNQLRLFLDPESDLGVRPENAIHAEGGAVQFKAKHSATQISSLSAFEKSKHQDDLRELMRRFMIRRTRSHIRDYHAKEDSRGKYLEFGNGGKYYFPARVVSPMDFPQEEKDDPYEKLHSPAVEEIIGTLALPRYGLKLYLREDADKIAKPGEDIIIENLNRAGKRMLGFARTGLFKRLESGGDAFLISIRRHITRNAVFLAALETGDKLPVGRPATEMLDDTIAESDDGEIFESEEREESAEGVEWSAFMKKGSEVCKQMLGDAKQAKEWPRPELFRCDELRRDLKKDCDALLKILKMVPTWDPARDRKLHALAKLCGDTHKEDKILIFTQYTETALYLMKQLRALKIGPVECAHGQKNTFAIAARFSPKSNDSPIGWQNEIRVLVATDAMSEGQNLQDAHIVVNYDLPWAVIRLTQRVGRVDRIGQTHEEILSYSAFPQDGLEDILNLRARLLQRIRQNNEIIGSDERHFHDEESGKKEDEKIRDLFSGTGELTEDDEGETDLVSSAHEIWRNAVKANPKLEKIIPQMPDVCFAAKQSRPASDKDEAPGGALAYVRISGNRVLTHIGENGEIRTQSQAEILKMMACEPKEKALEIPENHNDLVTVAAKRARESRDDIGGQLGGPSAPRRIAYNRLSAWAAENNDTVFAESEFVVDVKNAVQCIYDVPLRETARRQIGNQIRVDILDDDLAKMVVRLHKAGKLCENPKNEENDDDRNEPQIICSMGLVT